MNSYDYTHYLLTTDHRDAKLRYTQKEKGVMVELLTKEGDSILMYNYDGLEFSGIQKKTIKHLNDTYPSDHIIYQLIVNKLTKKGY